MVSFCQLQLFIWVVYLDQFHYYYNYYDSWFCYCLYFALNVIIYYYLIILLIVICFIFAVFNIVFVNIPNIIIRHYNDISKVSLY